MDKTLVSSLEEAASLIVKSRSFIAFTGAGISKESGVPTFRGTGGLWERIDPGTLEIGRFRRDPAGSWAAIRELFYPGSAKTPSLPGMTASPKPNAAHTILAAWEATGILDFLVTQNIDGLHRAAGSRRIAEFHGSIGALACMRCGERTLVTDEAMEAGLLDVLPPLCTAGGKGARACGGVLKPDFVFFGEDIPVAAYEAAFAAAGGADLCLVVGSTGLVHPAAEVPLAVKRGGGAIIEIDPGETAFSRGVADIHIRLGASEALTRLDELVRRDGGAVFRAVPNVAGHR